MPKSLCCQQAENLKPQPDVARPDVLVQVCQVCGARHITLHAEPGMFGLKGITLGHA